METVCVGLKAHQGWVNAVAVSTGSNSPVPVQVQRIDLFSGDDRLVSEPYHVAGGWHGLERVARPDDPSTVIHNGRRHQVAAAKSVFRLYNQSLLSCGWRWQRAVVLTGRGRLGDDLEHILGSHAQIHVAEGEAVREATRAALDGMGVEHSDQDEKSILAGASEVLGLRAAVCDEALKALKPPGAKAWRKEERLIALGAWLNCR